MSIQTLSGLIDATFNSIREYDTNNLDINISPDNINITVACLKNYYKLKIDLLLGFENDPKIKINKINKLIPEINSKLRALKMDTFNKDKMCADVVVMIADRIEQINSELVPLQQSSNIGDILKIYNQLHETENHLINMCGIIKKSFTGAYENIIIEKITDKLNQANATVDTIFKSEKYNIDQPILASYCDFCIFTKDLLKYRSDINIESVDIIITKKIISFHQDYCSVVSNFDDSAHVSILFILFNTVLKLKENIITLNLNSETNYVINLYCGIEKTIKNKLVNIYMRPINSLLNESILKTGVKYECAKKIADILNKINHIVVNTKTIELIWNSVIITMVSSIVTLIMATEYHLFEIEFTQSANILIGELITYTKKITKERFETVIDPSKYINDLFKRAELVVKFAICDKIAEKEVRDEFTTVYGDLKLYNSLCGLKKTKPKRFSPLSTLNKII